MSDRKNFFQQYKEMRPFEKYILALIFGWIIGKVLWSLF